MDSLLFSTLLEVRRYCSFHTHIFSLQGSTSRCQKKKKKAWKQLFWEKKMRPFLKTWTGNALESDLSQRAPVLDCNLGVSWCVVMC